MCELLMRQALDYKPLKPLQRLALLALALHAKKDGQGQITLQWLAGDCEEDAGEVARTLGELEQLGLVLVDDNPRTPLTQYQITINKAGV